MEPSDFGRRPPPTPPGKHPAQGAGAGLGGEGLPVRPVEVERVDGEGPAGAGDRADAALVRFGPVGISRGGRRRRAQWRRADLCRREVEWFRVIVAGGMCCGVWVVMLYLRLNAILFYDIKRVPKSWVLPIQTVKISVQISDLKQNVGRTSYGKSHENVGSVKLLCNGKVLIVAYAQVLRFQISRTVFGLIPYCSAVSRLLLTVRRNKFPIRIAGFCPYISTACRSVRTQRLLCRGESRFCIQ